MEWEGSRNFQMQHEGKKSWLEAFLCSEDTIKGMDTNLFSAQWTDNTSSR